MDYIGLLPDAQTEGAVGSGFAKTSATKGSNVHEEKP